MSRPVSEPRIAAIVYDRTDEVDRLIADFAAARVAEGRSVAGLVETQPGADACLTREMRLRDIASGTTIRICQDLGAGARGCRIDPRGLAQAASVLRVSIAAGPDLVVVNKFGKMEADGEGLIEEIGACVADGIPLVVGIPRRFAQTWDDFAGGLDEKVAPARDALEDWWARTALPAPQPS